MSEFNWDAIINRMTDREYWLSIGLGQTISTDGVPASAATAAERFGAAEDRLRREGYFDHPPVLATSDVEAARLAMAAVETAGWLPPLAFVFDAPWRLGRSGPVQRLATALLGPGHRLLPAFRAYHARPGDRGYRPGLEVADRQACLGVDGRPTAVTIWVPLTDATPDNGCMCVVPRHLAAQTRQLSVEEYLDEYGYGEDGMANFYMHRTRALPVPAGGLLAWHHSVLQWASCSSGFATTPLQSLAFEFIRGDMDPTLHPHALVPSEERTPRAVTFDPSGPLPTFEERLFWIMRNLRYHVGYPHLERYAPFVRHFLERCDSGLLAGLGQGA